MKSYSSWWPPYNAIAIQVGWALKPTLKPVTEYDECTGSPSQP